ncbi:CRISPR-associated protein Cas2 [Naumannella cuiyingiana]|uniref:CRISPR-associated endoribonuclease Cas2 n=1 Tax=Naumannella cuiyingiana TaxID=1347891 RepID=A0A7Z0IK48_9ACTN|nr:CRISPR-associated protein Cas2 [Naumannella cuiyingiana]
MAYDVNTTTPEGEKRLRRVARICEGFGQRVQYSVFEVTCSPTLFAQLLAKLQDTVDPELDSLRIYPIRSDFKRDVVRMGRCRELPTDRSWTI